MHKTPHRRFFRRPSPALAVKDRSPLASDFALGQPS
jgi:hypothetical protein